MSKEKLEVQSIMEKKLGSQVVEVKEDAKGLKRRFLVGLVARLSDAQCLIIDTT